MTGRRIPKPECDCCDTPEMPLELTMGIDFSSGGSISIEYQLDALGNYVPVRKTNIDGTEIDYREVN